MTHTSQHVVTWASDRVDKEGGLGPFLADVGFGGISGALILFVVTLIRGVQLMVVGPIRALGDGTIMLIGLFMQGLGDVFGAGTAETVEWFADGFGSFLGPLAQPFSVGVIMASFFVFAFAARRTPWSPWVFVANLNPIGG